jgi:Bacterial transcriptional activator domain
MSRLPSELVEATSTYLVLAPHVAVDLREFQAIAAVHADPLRDSATRVLIRSYLASGNPAEALRQFRSFRVRLARDLGLEPSLQMLELVRSSLAAGARHSPPLPKFRSKRRSSGRESSWSEISTSCWRPLRAAGGA